MSVMPFYTCDLIHCTYIFKEDNVVAERMKGIVKWFDSSKGYGYITPEQQGEDVFVHYSEINDGGLKNLTAGQQVEFSVEDDPRGPLAVEVTRL